ncbi:hypothetical protein MRX96_013691 [Rhipicephalus microplus]
MKTSAPRSVSSCGAAREPRISSLRPASSTASDAGVQDTIAARHGRPCVTMNDDEEVAGPRRRCSAATACGRARCKEEETRVDASVHRCRLINFTLAGPQLGLPD